MAAIADQGHLLRGRGRGGCDGSAGEACSHHKEHISAPEEMATRTG